MICLFFDTSSDLLKVSLIKDNKIIFDKELHTKNDHSSYLVPTIDEAFKSNNIDFKELDEIIVGNGPGSFTGTRISIAVAKTYAFSFNIPVYMISSLEELIYDNDGYDFYVPIIEEKKENLYFSIFDKDKKRVMDDTYSSTEYMYKKLEELDGKILLISLSDKEYEKYDTVKASINALNIMKNIEKHYRRMEIVKPSWENQDYLGIRKMLSATVNQNAKDKMPIPNMATMVLKAILEDDRYPESLYTDTLIRIRAEQGKITYGRAAILKAFLIQNYQWREGESYMGLNEECQETAYVLGRIFAVLEFIQKDANPGINTTIRDRYFNSACATPASVFPVLMKLKNSHIKKLERESVGKKIHFENLLTELIVRIEMTEGASGFPKRLSLDEQGKFMLGYYHQTQKMYEKKEEK